MFLWENSGQLFSERSRLPVSLFSFDGNADEDGVVTSQAIRRPSPIFEDSVIEEVNKPGSHQYWVGMDGNSSCILGLQTKQLVEAADIIFVSPWNWVNRKVLDA